MRIHRRSFLKTATGAWLALEGGLQAADRPRVSPFLQGNFAPVHEEVQADRLKVIGKLPVELGGMYVRNGPNPQFPPRGRYHWFDGDGMLHGVRLRDGQASYRNRYIRTAGWELEHKAGKALHGGLMELPDLVAVAKGEAGYKNTGNTALVWHNGKLLALWEAGPPHRIRPRDLATLGLEDLGGKLAHPFTAHPKIDAQSGDMRFFGYRPEKPYVVYSVASARGEIVHTMPIDIPRPVMMHDFAITERYSLFLDLPETFNVERLLQGKPVMQFQPELGARIGVLPHRGEGKEIRWFTVKPCFIFHTLNAHEEGDEVVLLACRMKAFPDQLNTPPENYDPKKEVDGGAVLYRYRLNLATGKVHEGPVDDRPSDFPRVADRLLGRKTRFGYTMTLTMDGLLKYDLEKGKSEEHSHGKQRFGGEAVFVPRPAGKTEDDGWLLTYVHDEGAGRSELVVIDARDFRGSPVARVLLPQRVPYGFHGLWLHDQQIGPG